MVCMKCSWKSLNVMVYEIVKRFIIIFIVY